MFGTEPLLQHIHTMHPSGEHMETMDSFSIIQSPKFTFLLGKDRTPLTIPSGLVKDISAPLNALMNNNRMQESISRTAVLEYVEVDTFIGFCEYAYAGAYTTRKYVPEEKEKEKEKEKEIDEPNTKHGDFKLAVQSSIPQLKVSYIQPEILHRVRDRSLRNFGGYFRGSEAILAENPDLMFHAKLYVFATQFMVSKLQTQCLKSLCRDLRGFYLGEQSVGRIFDLMEYTYANTGRTELGGPSGLRRLVIHYASCCVNILACRDRFHHVLDGNAEMGSDLVKTFG